MEIVLVIIPSGMLYDFIVNPYSPCVILRAMAPVGYLLVTRYSSSTRFSDRAEIGLHYAVDGTI